MRAKCVAGGLVVVLSVANAVAAGSPKATSMHGQVVAFRPGERIGQVVSGVINRETFLLRVEGGAVIKIVYKHDGYAEHPAGEVELKVHRDRSCDGSYGQFVSEAPVFTDETNSNPIPAVTKVEGFQGLPSSYKLKCYLMVPPKP